MLNCAIHLDQKCLLNQLTCTILKCPFTIFKMHIVPVVLNKYFRTKLNIMWFAISKIGTGRSIVTSLMSRSMLESCLQSCCEMFGVGVNTTWTWSEKHNRTFIYLKVGHLNSHMEATLLLYCFFNCF